MNKASFNLSQSVWVHTDVVLIEVRVAWFSQSFSFSCFTASEVKRLQLP